MDSKTLKKNIIQAGMKAVEQLIKVAKEDIIKLDPEDELAAAGVTPVLSPLKPLPSNLLVLVHTYSRGSS